MNKKDKAIEDLIKLVELMDRAIWYKKGKPVPVVDSLYCTELEAIKASLEEKEPEPNRFYWHRTGLGHDFYTPEELFKIIGHKSISIKPFGGDMTTCYLMDNDSDRILGYLGDVPELPRYKAKPEKKEEEEPRSNYFHWSSFRKGGVKFNTLIELLDFIGWEWNCRISIDKSDNDTYLVDTILVDTKTKLVDTKTKGFLGWLKYDIPELPRYESKPVSKAQTWIDNHILINLSKENAATEDKLQKLIEIVDGALSVIVYNNARCVLPSSLKDRITRLKEGEPE